MNFPRCKNYGNLLESRRGKIWKILREKPALLGTRAIGDASSCSSCLYFLRVGILRLEQLIEARDLQEDFWPREYVYYQLTTYFITA